MHLLALVQDPDNVSGRYRAAAYQSYLESAGHTLALHPVPRDWRAWWRLAGALRRADVVILQRHLLPRAQIAWLRALSSRLVFDFDDAVFRNDSHDRRGLAAPHKLRSFAATVRAADFVVAGNEYLARQAARWIGRQRTAVIPTGVEPRCYPLAQHARSGLDAELVWIGSASTLQGLERARALFEALGSQRPGTRLKLVCDRGLELRDWSVSVCPWTAAGEAQALAAADIGISWLPEDDWSRGKCGLKVLQYMAAGLPVVANPVGVQNELVRHGVTGYLASTAAEWTAAVQRLADDPPLRRRLGQAGRQQALAGFTVEGGARKWLELLRRRQRAAG
jgi:glycosyltransferase involved in cell wall biosynthesis